MFRIVSIAPMVPARRPNAFKTGFTARIREARNSINFTQQQMATALGIAQDTYKQYEGRSYLPYHLVAQFCAITRKSEAWLFTGHEARKSQHQPPTHGRARPHPFGREDDGPRKKHHH